MKKRLIAGVLAASMCLAAASCGGSEVKETTDEPATEVTETTTGAEVQETTTAELETTTETTTSATTENPVVSTDFYDIEWASVGKYITFIYNEEAADVKWEVQKGVGSRETVTFTVTLRDGYVFDGWSEEDAIVNGNSAISKELTYTIDVSAAKKLYLNTSIQLVYHANGGEIAKAGFDGTDTYSNVFYHNPNTLPEQGYFKRDGYMLTGYNTKADGTGEEVSLGSKVTANGQGKIDVYCIWEKITPEEDFEVKTTGSNVKITLYKGTDTNVVIPETIGGKKVIGITDGAFEKVDVVRVVIPKTVKEIEDYAFYKCASLTSVVMFDTVQKIGKDAFDSCNAFTTGLRLNSTNTLLDSFQTQCSSKIDRLIWAKDKKKIIIVGGSGSIQGYNSAILDKALGGEYEIINFGENANVTSIVYFDIIEDFIQEGDIVLWCPEPGTYTLGYPSCSNGRFWEFRASHYDFTKYINVQNYGNLFPCLGTYGTTLATSKFMSYDALVNTISKYGDDVSDRSFKGYNNKSPYNLGYAFGGKEIITEHVQNIIAKGGSVFFSFAAMGESKIALNKESEFLAYEKLITSVPGIVSISDYKNCVYEDKYLNDSEWHLNDEGAILRSERVAQDLLKALGKS